MAKVSEGTSGRTNCLCSADRAAGRRRAGRFDRLRPELVASRSALSLLALRLKRVCCHLAPVARDEHPPPRTLSSISRRHCNVSGSRSVDCWVATKRHFQTTDSHCSLLVCRLPPRAQRPPRRRRPTGPVAAGRGWRPSPLTSTRC